MGDIKNPKLIYLKGFLFLFAGLLASTALLLEYATLQHAFLLAVAVWSFARFYYFAFYVIQYYVDPGYRFAGVGDFVLYLLKHPIPAPSQTTESPQSSPAEPPSGKM